MKNLFIVILITLLSTIAFAQEWYKNGTLHGSTIKIWKQSSYDNKIATSADWVLAGSKSIKSKVVNSGDIDNLKPYAKELVVCIDGATKDHSNWDSSTATDVAVSCMAQMGWLQ